MSSEFFLLDRRAEGASTPCSPGGHTRARRLGPGVPSLHARRALQGTARPTERGPQQVHRTSPAFRLGALPPGLPRLPHRAPRGASTAQSAPPPIDGTRGVGRDGLSRRHPEAARRRTGGAGDRHRRATGYARDPRSPRRRPPPAPLARGEETHHSHTPPSASDHRAQRKRRG